VKKLLKSRTFWTALAGTVTAIGGFVTGHASLAQTLQAILIAAFGMSLNSDVVRALLAKE